MIKCLIKCLPRRSRASKKTILSSYLDSALTIVLIRALISKLCKSLVGQLMEIRNSLMLLCFLVVTLQSKFVIADFDKLRAARCHGLKELSVVTERTVLESGQRYADALAELRKITAQQEAGKARYQELNDAKKEVRILGETRDQILNDLDGYLLKTISICGTE